MSDILALILTFIILIIAYFTGSANEKKHYESIKRRETIFLKLPSTTTSKNVLAKDKKVKESYVVTGCAVIGSDYFKDFVASFRQFLGGRLVSYESLIDRARREAILRMKKSAKKADIIINTKLDTTMINDSTNNEPAQVAVIAYGTAIAYED